MDARWTACGALMIAGLVALSSPCGARQLPPGEAVAAAYPLDPLPRVVPEGEPLACARGEVPTVAYRGTHLRYQPTARVHPAFRAKLDAFEQVIVEVAREHYGRAPRSLRHLGTYNCRRMRRYPTWVSEHAFGNGIDLAGLDFGPLPRAADAPDDLPAALRRAFRVRVESHWGKGRGVAAHHARFLAALASRLVEREDIFHVLLGPGWPGHHNHFHFDRAPYRVVEGFDD